MKVDWSPLTRELAHWRRSNLALPIWWRDDDAVADTPELARLSALSREMGLPVHVAVIPDVMEPGLVPALRLYENLVPVIHGWRHISHTPAGTKNAEFGHLRDGADDEIVQAFNKMQDAFGTALVPLFVPPWNRIAPSFYPALSSSGYAGVSAYGPREAALTDEGLLRINTHIDPIFWRGDRGLVDPDVLVSTLVATLQDRRTGAADNDEPLGLLTHHLVHTARIWEFSHDVIAVLLNCGARPADIAALLQVPHRSDI